MYSVQYETRTISSGASTMGRLLSKANEDGLVTDVETSASMPGTPTERSNDCFVCCLVYVATGRTAASTRTLNESDARSSADQQDILTVLLLHKAKPAFNDLRSRMAFEKRDSRPEPYFVGTMRPLF